LVFLINKRKKYIIQNIDEIKSKQNFWGNLLNYGDVIIHDSMIKEDITLKSIQNPNIFVENMQSNLKKGNLFIINKNN